MLRFPALVAVAVAVLAAGCGSDSSSSSSDSRPKTTASSPAAKPFPKPAGRSLQAVADTVKPGLHVGLAAQTFVPGTSRLPFALLDSQRRFLDGPAAVYVADSPGKPARGPYAAPSESFDVRPAFRSKVTDDAEIKRVYASSIPFRRAGSYAVLVVLQRAGGLVGGATGIKVAARSPIPGVGRPAPRIDTPTVASAAGDLKKIDTRIPPEREMHATSFKDVVGRRPVALLFSTPALCQTAVCGPVTDVLLELREKYQDRVAFVHQEIYRDNQVNKGLRPQLAAFHLRTEPWLFTIDRRGRIAARLEGAFGLEGAERAIARALR